MRIDQAVQKSNPTSDYRAIPVSGQQMTDFVLRGVISKPWLDAETKHHEDLFAHTDSSVSATTKVT
jgi:hypothetical protein